MLHRSDRRAFLQSTAALLAAWHVPGRTSASPAVPCIDHNTPGLLQMKLHTAKLDELRRFYHRLFGLSIVQESAAGFTLGAGASTLEWQTAAPGAEPFYHFAFNIPENRFAQAKAWLARRTPLLRDFLTSKDEVYFRAWDSHAVYFRDPAGNIGELIARHPLKNPSEQAFSVEQFLCISEIGLVTPNPQALSKELADRLQWTATGNELYFIGDGNGYLIAAPTGRAWLPDRVQQAIAAPVEVTVQAKLPQPVTALAGAIQVRGK